MSPFVRIVVIAGIMNQVQTAINLEQFCGIPLIFFPTRID